MKSKLCLCVVFCLLYAICTGQWSDPVPVLPGEPPVVGQSLVAGGGDTMWAAVVTGQPGATGPYQVLACWTAGDTWSPPVEITPPDPRWTISEPGMGRDASGRLWIAWYRGDYPAKGTDSGAVWAAFRDSAGWHAPEIVCSSVAATGPMSFAADAQGNWFLGFATLTPYADAAYSSAAYSVWIGDSWQAPRYIARGTGGPIEIDCSAPKLVTRPDSGLWAAYEMSTGGSGAVSMVKIVQGDSARRCWTANATDPAVTADSSGRLWVLYSELAMYWLSAQVIDDSTPVDTTLITEMAGGPAHVTTDPEGWLWATWPIRSSQRVVVNYTRGTDWSSPEAASDSNCVPVGIAADANGRVRVLYKAADGKLHSTYRTSRPGVLVQTTRVIAGSCVPTVIRNVLSIPPALPTPPSSLLSIDGRKVMDLRPGANDVSALSPGVYFVREGPQAASLKPQAVRKVVVSR